MRREKTLFIYNPHAGKGAMRSKLSEVIEYFMQSGLEVTIYATRKEREATDIVIEHGEKYERVICSGGDGTLHEVTHGLMEIPVEHRPKCGYIPTGTVNDFASGIKLPKRIIPAAKIAAGDTSRAYDVGDMNGKYFTYVAAFGAFTSVSYETPQSSKNMLGRTAYFLEGVSQLSSIKSTFVNVKVDETEWEGECVLGMVTNARTVGGLNLFKNQRVQLDDGLFDCVFVKMPQNPIELNLVMSYLVTGTPNQQIYRMKGKSIEIVASEKIAYTLDGEQGGEYKKAVITNHKQAITYFYG